MARKGDWPSQWLSTARDEMTSSRHGLAQRGEEGEDGRMELNASTAPAWVWSTGGCVAVKSSKRKQGELGIAGAVAVPLRSVPLGWHLAT